jgi:hypothetical protein
MKSQSLHLLIILLIGSAITTAQNTNFCQITAQDALNSCQKKAESNFWNVQGTCVNLTDPSARQACLALGNSSYQSNLLSCQSQLAARQLVCSKVGAGPYNPPINPANFTTNIDNPYSPFKPGTIWLYAGPTSEGYQQDTVEVTFNTKIIDGVTCVEVHDRVYINEALAEDTLDWYAQDKEGNVWYFGEASEELENSRVTTVSGSWQAGVAGAQPGIIMLAHPTIGQYYRQEFQLNTAEDVAGVISLNQTVIVPAGKFDDLVETEEITGLEPGALEHKYYAKGVGNVLTIDEVTGDFFPLVQVTGN